MWGQTQRSVQSLWRTREDERRAGNRVHVAHGLVRGGRLRQAREEQRRPAPGHGPNPRRTTVLLAASQHRLGRLLKETKAGNRQEAVKQSAGAPSK